MAGLAEVVQAVATMRLLDSDPGKAVRKAAFECIPLSRPNDDEVTPGTPPDPAWLDPRDGGAAVLAALAREARHELKWQARYRVVHVCAPAPRPRSLLQGARRLGLAPRYDFAAAWTQAEGAP